MAMHRIFVIPAKDRLVRDCRTFRALKADGEWKAWTQEWQLAVIHGDVTCTHDESGALAPKPKPVKKLKPEQRHEPNKGNKEG